MTYCVLRTWLLNLSLVRPRIVSGGAKNSPGLRNPHPWFKRAAYVLVRNPFRETSTPFFQWANHGGSAKQDLMMSATLMT